jgi:enterochelin esterase-like enzyme
MKRIRYVLLAGVMAASCVQAASQVMDALPVKSEILGKEMKVAVYLPDGYASSQRSYPVLYLLHGYSDDQTGWVQFGEVQRIADQAISEGRAAPMIIVMPDAEVTWYANDLKGQYRFEDYFFTELIPHVESTYRCRAKKEFRAVSGLSMGGMGAFVYAMRHPELFASSCPLSAALWDRAAMSKRMKLGEQGETEEKINAFLDRYCPVTLAERMPEEQKKAVRLYIDCGDDDFHSADNARMHALLLEKKIPHEFRIRDGAHSWEYWRTALPSVLEFVSGTFRR